MQEKGERGNSRHRVAAPHRTEAMFQWPAAGDNEPNEGRKSPLTRSW